MYDIYDEKGHGDYNWVFCDSGSEGGIA